VRKPAVEGLPLRTSQNPIIQAVIFDLAPAGVAKR
jgi:hypothetical protein